MDKYVDISPPHEFQQAFEEVFGLPCSPANLIGAIRDADPRLARVDELAATYRDAETRLPK
jgi:hypothetical protein